MAQIKRRGRKKKYQIGDIFTRKVYRNSPTEIWLCVEILSIKQTKSTYYIFEIQNPHINPTQIKYWKLTTASIDNLLNTTTDISYYHVIPHKQ